jgi:hypothetical protein
MARLAVGPVEEECGSGGLLCLDGGRFHARAFWRTADGQQGSGRAVSLTGDTGGFWFFAEDNPEVVLKVVDGCTLNDGFWVFAAGLTDVEVELMVQDTWSGETRSYRNPSGRAFPPIQDTAAFVTCGAAGAAQWRPAVLAPEAPTADQSCGGPESLCLLDGRFRVRVDWSASSQESGQGTARRLTGEAGYFSFFDEDNVELVVKVLDGCAVNGHRWVFAAGLTDVATILTVEDLHTGETAVYETAGGAAFRPVQDTSALAGCP